MFDFPGSDSQPLPMYRLLEFVIAAVLTVLLFVVIALFLPSAAQVERRIELSNPTTQVYDVLNHFKRYNQWQPWAANDPLTKYSIEGAEFGVGAKFNWNSPFNNEIGVGSLQIVESAPDERIVMALDNSWRGHDKTQTFLLEPDTKTNSVTLRWIINVTYGWDLIGRFAGLYLNGNVGESMRTGLGRFANVMTSVPNVDYSQVEIAVVDVPPVDLLFVGAAAPAAPRRWDEAVVIMDKAWDEVATFVERNSVVPIGDKRRIVNVLGEENNDFNIGYAVPPNALVPTGNIRAVQSLGTRALTTQYRGHRVGLGKARDMLRAYAITHGYQYDRDLRGAWEEWPPENEETGEVLTTLYLPFN
jgi:uncharacterized protein YndB with AHSA1/START domain